MRINWFTIFSKSRYTPQKIAMWFVTRWYLKPTYRKNWDLTTVNLFSAVHSLLCSTLWLHTMMPNIYNILFRVFIIRSNAYKVKNQEPRSRARERAKFSHFLRVTTQEKREPPIFLLLLEPFSPVNFFFYLTHESFWLSCELYRYYNSIFFFSLFEELATLNKIWKRQKISHEKMIKFHKHQFFFLHNLFVYLLISLLLLPKTLFAYILGKE